MSTPRISTGPDRAPESGNFNPSTETEREVRHVDDEVRGAGLDRVRENLQVTWNEGTKNGKAYGDAQINGIVYRVYEDGRAYRQEGSKLKRVPASELGTLPAAAQTRIGLLEGETSSGTQYTRIIVDGLKYRALESGKVWRQVPGQQKYEAVRPEDISDLPPVVQDIVESVRPQWRNTKANGTRYKVIEYASGKQYAISEHGRVLRKERGGANEYVMPGETLPPLVSEKLEKVLAYVRGKEQLRQRQQAEMNPELSDREQDLQKAGEVLSTLQGIRIENGGQSFSIEGLPGTREQMFSRLSKMSIRPDRYSEFVDNLKQAAERLDKVFARYVPPNDPWKGAVEWNPTLNRLESECTEEGNNWKGERIVATAVDVLRQPAGKPRYGEGYGGSRSENFYTFPTGGVESYQVVRKDPSFKITRRDSRTGRLVTSEVPHDRNLTKYRMYEHHHPEGKRYDYLVSDGGLRMRKTGSESGASTIQTFDDGSNTRPVTVSVRRPTEVSYTATSDPSSGRVKQRFDRSGNYALDREGGKPVGNFRDFSARVESGELQVPAGMDKREAYANFITENIKTPEAIANFISEHISFDASGTEGAVDYLSEEGQDVQHPLVTLERGRGDCDDFAILFDYMSEKIGVSALTVRKNSVHFVSVYFEERYVEEEGSMQKRYDAVVMDTSGFRRTTTKKPEGYKSEGEALKDLVSADMRTKFLPRIAAKYGALERRDPSTLSESDRNNLAMLQEARETASPEGPGGVELLYPPDTVLPMGSRQKTRGSSGFMAFNEDLDRYVISDSTSSRRRSAERRARQNRPSFARSGSPSRSELATRNVDASSELAKIQEAQRYPRNQWRTLSSGQPGYQYFMDNQEHLFASREPSNTAIGYEYLNTANGSYRWEHQSYS